MNLDESLPGAAVRGLLGGELGVSDESLEVRWVPAGELDDLPMHHTQRLRLRHYREDRHTPHLG